VFLRRQTVFDFNSLTCHRGVGEATLVLGGYLPDDLDTTSLALLALPPKQPESIASVLDQMADCVTLEGSFLVRSSKYQVNLLGR
jgi:hypothetical protein